MLPKDMKKCSMCKREFPNYETFMTLTISWERDDRSAGRYSNHLCCTQCCNIVKDEINKAFHKAQRKCLDLE